MPLDQAAPGGQQAPPQPPPLQPAFRLPAMPLPPPTGQAADSRSLASRALLSLALLFGVIVLAVAIVGALVAANVVIWIVGDGAFIDELVVATLVVAGSLGYAMVALLRRPPEPAGEIEVPREAEPTLHAMVEAIAGRIGVRPPDRIVLTWEVNAYVREFGPWFGLAHGKRTLAIGTPLFDLLDVTSLAAVLGHELGHFAGGDTRLAPLAVRTDQVLDRLTSSLKGRRIIVRLFHAYWGFQRRVSAGARRAQEVVADRSMVQIAGRQAAVEALRAVRVAAIGQQVLLAQYVEPLLQHGRRPDDMSAWLRMMAGDPETLEKLAAAAAQPPQEYDPWATHPPLPERIVRLVALTDDPSAPPHDWRAARILLSAPDRWAKVAEDRWWELATSDNAAASLQPIAWPEWADTVLGGVHREQTRDVDTVLGRLGLPTGVSGIYAALGDGRERELAGGLIAEGWRLSAPGGGDEHVVVIRAALLASLAVQAIDVGGCRWESRPSGDHELVGRSGSPVGLADRVDSALAGDWRGLLTAPAPAAAVASNLAPNAAMPADRTADPTMAPEPPSPPSPPFEPGSGGWLWMAKLPSKYGMRAVIRVGRDTLGLGTTDVPFDAITGVALEWKPGGSRDITAKVVLDRADGKQVVWKAHAVGKQRNALMPGLAYLEALLSVRVGPRLRAEIVGQIVAGATVEVGGLLLSPAGVAPRRKPENVIGWGDVGDPHADDDTFTVPTRSGALTTPTKRVNTFLLPSLVPELRVRFG